MRREEGGGRRGKREEGRGKKKEGRGKREEGRREEGRGKREEGRGRREDVDMYIQLYSQGRKEGRGLPQETPPGPKSKHLKFWGCCGNTGSDSDPSGLSIPICLLCGGQAGCKDSSTKKAVQKPVQNKPVQTATMKRW
jgi:hypothetical protein